MTCGYAYHDFKPTGRTDKVKTFWGKDTITLTEFECIKCGISTSWEVPK